MPLVRVEKASLVWDDGAVSGFCHHPTRGAAYLVLAHGAGGNLHTPSLVHFAEALAEAGVGAVVRTTREAGRWKPGDRFWVQVRVYTPDAVLLRFFNIETAEKPDRVYPRGETPGAPGG